MLSKRCMHHSMVDLYPSENLNAWNLLSVRHFAYKLLFHVHLFRFGDILIWIDSSRLRVTLSYLQNTGRRNSVTDRRISFGGNIIHDTPYAKNIGAYFDRTLSMEKQCNAIARSCLSLLVLQWGLRFGPIQRNGAAPGVIHTGRFFVLIPLKWLEKLTGVKDKYI
jgi:hypothetical protein